MMKWILERRGIYNEKPLLGFALIDCENTKTCNRIKLTFVVAMITLVEACPVSDISMSTKILRLQCCLAMGQKFQKVEKKCPELIT